MCTVGIPLMTDLGVKHVAVRTFDHTKSAYSCACTDITYFVHEAIKSTLTTEQGLCFLKVVLRSLLLRQCISVKEMCIIILTLHSYTLCAYLQRNSVY